MNSPALMTQVESRLRAALDERELPGVPPGPRVLGDASRHLCFAGGAKRMRPELVAWIGELLGVPDAVLARVAVAAEMIHGASLLHDDVVDEGTVRRGQPTANARFGNAAAVLAGDWLLTRAFMELVGLPSSLTDGAVATLAQMTAAAMREIEARGRADQTLASWRQIAEGKTGALFAWCGKATALASSRPATATAWDAFGRHLGVAFQMADDLNDLCDPTAQKDRFADLRTRTPSFVLVLAMERAPEIRRSIEAAWTAPELTDGRVAELGAMLLASDVRRVATALFEAELGRAVAAVAAIGVPDWESGFWRLAERFVGGFAKGNS